MFSSVVLILTAILLTANAQDCTPPKMLPHECCPGYMPTTVTRAVFAECGLPQDTPPFTAPPCDVTTCVMKKCNVLTPDNKVVDRATFISALEPQYAADFKSLIGPSYDACIDQATKAPCGLTSFIFCVKGHMLKNCPASAQVSGPDCIATKMFFDKCISKMI